MSDAHRSAPLVQICVRCAKPAGSVFCADCLARVGVCVLRPPAEHRPGCDPRDCYCLLLSISDDEEEDNLWWLDSELTIEDKAELYSDLDP